MTYKTIGDSRLDLAGDMKKNPRFQTIPLTLRVGSIQVVDDRTSDQKQFIEMIKVCPGCPETVCPSSEAFRAAFEEAEVEVVFAITLSSHLSGSYNSVAMVEKLYEEEMAEKGMAEQARKVAVIDSFSASSGELNIVLFIQDLCDPGLGFDGVAEETLTYRGDVNTYFVLESLDTLHKNGRLSGLQAFFITALNIKPAMGADIRTIVKLDQARGMNKALQRMYGIAIREVADAASRIAVVCHVNNPERAKYVEDELAKRAGFRKIVITNAADVATVYASDGGIVLTA